MIVFHIARILRRLSFSISRSRFRSSFSRVSIRLIPFDEKFRGAMALFKILLRLFEETFWQPQLTKIRQGFTDQIIELVNRYRRY